MDTFWTEERVQALIRRWDYGGGNITMTEIAKEFGTSKSAIAGKINRLKIQKDPISRTNPRKRVYRYTNDEDRRFAKNARDRRWRDKKLKPSKEPEMITRRIKRPVVKYNFNKPPVVAPSSKPVSLVARTPDMCSYLIGPLTCCGDEVTKIINGLGQLVSTSWCEYHYHLVYQTDRSKRCKNTITANSAETTQS